MDPHSITWANTRRLGDVYVGLCAWQLLGLDRLLERLVGRFRTTVPLPLIAAMIAVNRLVDPRSELGIFAWLPTTALPELLQVPRGRIHLNLLYRCLSEVERHKKTLEAHLVQQGRDLFDFANDLVLYDLTSSYFEGRLAGNPKAQRGYSRDHRPDCKQLCIGLAVNRSGFPLGFESLAGNCRNRPYLCAVRRARVRAYLPQIREGCWQTVRGRDHEPAIEVQELPTQEIDNVRERWLLCRSAGCQLKEGQIFEARLAKARQQLARLQAQVAAGTFTRNEVILRKAKRAVGRTHDLRGVFTFRVRRLAAGKELIVQENSAALQDERDLQGVYLLRTTADLASDELWPTYMLLTRVEAAFRNLKTDLCLRPIFHSKEARADAHVLFAVLAYALSVTIQLRHRAQGRERTTAALLETLERLQLAELAFQTMDGEWLRFERANIPTAEQADILETLGWRLPEKYLPPNLGTDPARL
jgi:hypothetical protein